MWRCWGLQPGCELGFRDRTGTQVTRHPKKRDTNIKKALAESQHSTYA